MSIEKCLDFTNGYNRKSDESTPTTRGDMYRFISNQNNVLMNLASGIWQPSTSYTVGAIIRSPNLPAGCVATCTTAGTSGTTEPKWTAYGTTVTDGSCKWKVNTDSQDTMVSERTKAINDMHTSITGEITEAINALHDTIKSEMETAMLALFPVGTVLETTNSANPSTYIGGTWELLPAGLTTISAGTYTETHNVNGTNVTDTYVFTAGNSEFTVNGTKTHGEAKHQITEGELAHLEGRFPGAIASGFQEDCTGIVSGTSIPSFTKSSNASGVNTWGFKVAFGNNQPHNNMAPSYGVFRFRRTI